MSRQSWLAPNTNDIGPIAKVENNEHGGKEDQEAPVQTHIFDSADVQSSLVALRLLLCPV